MDSIAEELYNRRFITKADSIEKQKERLNLSALMERHEKRLSELLNDEGKEIFEKYQDCCNELDSDSCLEAFMSGFRMGGKIVLEIVFGTDGFKLNE